MNEEIKLILRGIRHLVHRDRLDESNRGICDNSLINEIDELIYPKKSNAEQRIKESLAQSEASTQ